MWTFQSYLITRSILIDFHIESFTSLLMKNQLGIHQTLLARQIEFMSLDCVTTKL